MEHNTIENILQLRQQGLSIRDISNKLEISFAAVRYQCRKNNLGGKRSEDTLKSIRLERFIFAFNKHHGEGFEYVSGFIDSESPVQIKCRACGSIFERNAQVARKNKQLTCVTCQMINKSDKENQLLRADILRHSIKLDRAVKEVHISKCIECGKCYAKQRSSCCSNQCKKRRQNRLKEIKRRRQLKENGKIDYSITLSDVITRESNCCYLCGGQCDSNDFTIDEHENFIVGAKYPSIEHVIPVSKGGTHTWDNIKLAHHYCNTVKNDKDIIEKSGQMILIV